MLCPKCKNEISDGVKFCPKCGNQMKIGSSFGTKKIVAGVAAILVGIGCFAMFSGNNSTGGKVQIPVTAEARAASDELCQKGIALYRKGNIQEAAQMLSDAVHRNPTNSKAYFYRSLCHTKMKNKDESLADINMAIKYNPNDYLLYKARGDCWFYDQGKYDEAVEDYTRVIAVGKGNLETYMLRGASNLHLNKTQNALNDLEKAASYVNEKISNNDKSRLYKYIGDAYYKARNFKDAIESYTVALKNNNENDLAAENRVKAAKNFVASNGDLSVLRAMTHDELAPLADAINKRTEGKLKKYPNYDSKNYRKIDKEIATELSLLADHDWMNFINTFMGNERGVSYETMLNDAGDKLHVDLSKCKTNIEKEMELLKAFEKNGQKYPDNLVNYSQLGKVFNITDIVQGADGTILDALAKIGEAMYKASEPAYDITIPATMYIAKKRRDIMKSPIIIDNPVKK